MTPLPRLLAAAARVLDTAADLPPVDVGLDPGADTWLVPAEALWTALYYSNALDTYDLDETDAAMEVLAAPCAPGRGAHEHSPLSRR